MSKTVVIKCTCKSEFQDALYGKGLRLHNTSEISSGKNKKVAYCTVCCKRSSDKQTKDVLVTEQKNFGVKFNTIAEKPRIAKPY